MLRSSFYSRGVPSRSQGKKVAKKRPKKKEVRCKGLIGGKIRQRNEGDVTEGGTKKVDAEVGKTHDGASQPMWKSVRTASWEKRR